MPVDSEAYKRALGAWASGVSIVTARSDERIHGMTVSAFASVSLEPPLVLVCADKTSETHGVVASSQAFAVNVLTREQKDLSRRFALEKDEHLRFQGVDWTAGATGSPLIDGSLVTLDCRVVAAHDAGDHVIYVGQVESAHTNPGEPLLYYGGRYRELHGSDR